MRYAALLLLAMLVAPLARAEPMVGETAPHVLTVAGKQVPLPAGNWVVAGQSTGAVAQGSSLGSYGTIWNLVLFRLSPAGTIDAMVEINVNDIALTDGWGIPADCQRHDLLFAAARGQSGWDAACFFIARATRTDADKLPAAWRQAERTAMHQGLALPTGTIMAGFRAANRRDVIDARFHFPAASNNEREIADWSAMMIGCIEAGLKNRLPAPLAVPMPGAGGSALQQISQSHHKQQQLDTLLAAGVLSAQDYSRQVSLLRRAEASDAAGDPADDQFYQLLSFQGLSVTSDALVTFLWTAQSVQAAALTVLQAGFRAGRSYVVSYLWDSYGGTPTRPDVARTVDFDYGRTAIAASRQ